MYINLSVSSLSFKPFYSFLSSLLKYSNLLKELNVVSSASKDFLGDLKLNKIFKDNLVSTKKIISEAVLNDISTPVLSASLNWYLNLSSSSNPSNLIQAQRDFFGRHKVQLVDSEEDVNIDWD